MTFHTECHSDFDRIDKLDPAPSTKQMRKIGSYLTRHVKEF